MSLESEIHFSSSGPLTRNSCGHNLWAKVLSSQPANHDCSGVMLSPYPGLQNKHQKQLISILSLSLRIWSHYVGFSVVLHPNYPPLVFSHWCKDTGRSHPAEQRDTHPTDAINEPSTVCRPEILLCLWGHDTLPPTRHHHYTIVVIIFRIVCSPSGEPIKRRQIKVSQKL